MKVRTAIPLAAAIPVVGVLLTVALARHSTARPGSAEAATATPLAGPPFTNHLTSEKSPYLLEHAHNPVDWYPWGVAAFAKARQEDKPIFLSIGYFTCHWCHVMEHEAFENPEIARLLNDHFICVKVDREERPDVDRVYMAFVEATTGGGGWPLSIWLTPNLKPFFGGTYYPPTQFAGLLRKIAAAWRTDRQNIIASSGSIIRQLRQLGDAAPSASIQLGKELLDRAYDQIKSQDDPRYGGFGGAPKFPRPVVLSFLLRDYARTGRQEALDMALITLRRMAEGGIHDQIGGGFHRYATDARWRVPHFEKMLYDQAQLAEAYLDAYQITHDQFYAGLARDILAYVQRDLTGPQGRFYAGEDADSPLPGHPGKEAEGAFYLWQEARIVGVLGRDDADIFDYYYGVEKGGNLDSDPLGAFKGENVPIVSHSIGDTAKAFHRSPAQIRTVLAEARRQLFAVRSRRSRPRRDDQAITAWNGLMISAFARAYQVLDDPRYLTAARRAAQFVRTHLYEAKSGQLLRRYRAGQAAVAGFADDYAFLIQSLLDLYEAGFDVRDLEWANQLQVEQNQRFWDRAKGGYFNTPANDPNILLRVKEDYDGAEPSPSSVAVLNLLRLAQMLEEKPFQTMADKALTAFGTRLQHTPSALPEMLVGLEFDLAEPTQVVIAGKPRAPDTRAMLRAVYERFVPGKIMLMADGGEGQAFLARRLEFIRDVKPMAGKATAFVCRDYVCQLPTTNVARMVALLEKGMMQLSQPK